ncbi:MAG TPA: MmgE/PrpD family protein [Pseudonocardia sp.]|nr:MmgE/PrpD family protein [Pseudonocardia sp.]
MATPTLDTTKTEVEKHGITRTLSEYLVGLRYEDIPAEAVDLVKLFSLECLGHMVHALAQPVGGLLVRYVRDLGAAPQATVAGAGIKTSVAEAAYVNGSLAHGEELEAYGTLPGTGLIPPIVAGFAAGEYRERSGRDLITAVVAGIEMQGRLGMAGIGACDRGFMGISLVGPGGAGVAAGGLYGLDATQMQHCLGTALPLSNGSLRGCGSMSHVHEAGIPARTGVFAAQLAAGGFLSCPDFLDGEHSWGEQFAGTGGRRPYAPELLTDGLGDSLFLLKAGVAPKRYGSCGLTHQTIFGTIEIMREHGIGPDDIRSIELRVPPFADRVAPFRDPVNGEQAKFSIRQGVAGLLVEGIPELPYMSAFSDEASRDPRYVAARERVTIVVQDGESVRGFADQTVLVTCNDGRTIEKVVPALEQATYTRDERLAMFRNTAVPLGDSGTDQLIDTVMNLENHTVAEVMALVAGTASP